MTTLLSFGADEPIALGPDGTAPTELRLFRRGENHTAKGTFVFDDEAARRVMSTYAEMGRAWVMVDYDHGSLQKAPVDPSRSSRAAGTARLELRDGELWATNIRWTPDAKKSIEAGEWPSISPAFSYDEQGRPSWLINFGLTGNPATYAPAELIAANAILERLDALTAALTPAPEAAPTPAPRRATTAQLGLFTGNCKMRMNKLGMLMAAKGKTAADLAKALGIEEMEAMGLMMGDDDEMEGMGMKPAMYSVLSLAPAAPAADVEKRIGALADVEVKLLSVTGEKSASAALGTVEAWKTDATKAKELGDKLAKIEADGLAARVDTMLAAAKGEKRITEPEIADLRTKGLQDETWLSGYLAKRQPIAALAENFEQPKTTPKDGSANQATVDIGDRKFESLSGVEQARLYTDAPEQYAALKADWESRGRPVFTSLRAA